MDESDTVPVDRAQVPNLLLGTDSVDDDDVAFFVQLNVFAGLLGDPSAVGLPIETLALLNQTASVVTDIRVEQQLPRRDPVGGESFEGLFGDDGFTGCNGSRDCDQILQGPSPPIDGQSTPARLF